MVKCKNCDIEYDASVYDQNVCNSGRRLVALNADPNNKEDPGRCPHKGHEDKCDFYEEED